LIGATNNILATSDAELDSGFAIKPGFITVKV